MDLTIPRALGAALALALPAALLAPNAQAQQSLGGGPRQLGVNLDDILDFSTEWTFVDVFMHARAWISQDVGFGGPFDNGGTVNTTPEGWPLLPPDQAAATLMLNNIDGRYPGGIYTCFYDGTGDVLFGNDAFVLTSNPGVITMNVNPGDGGIFMKIENSDINDPVRNIRVVMPGFEETFEDQPFHPTFMERLKPYGALRFLRWQRINDSEQSLWADRTTKDTYSQATDNGVAVEYMIELCNKLGKDAWVHVPHLADDNWVTEFATMLRDELDPGLQIYLEYSNEVWNFQTYEQGQYTQTQGLIAGYFTTNPWQSGVSWYAERAVQIFDNFYNVFGAEAPNRITRVMGAMAAFTGPADWALSFANSAASTDVLAIAPYFASSFGFPDQAPTTLGWDVPRLLDEAEATITGEVTDWITSNMAIADSYNLGIQTVSAEGGQRMAAEGQFVGNTTLTNLFVDANRDPRMEDLYDLYFQTWDQLTNGGLMMAYVNAREFGTFGAYGILEYQNQPIDEAPKYRAILTQSESLIGSRPFGEGCAPVEIATNGVPTVGQDLNLTLKSEQPNSTAILALGFSNTDWIGIPLPFNLGVLFAPDCNLYTSLDLVFGAATDSEGGATVSIPIPNNPGLTNATLYAQWALTDPTANLPLGMVFTQGLEMTLQ